MSAMKNSTLFTHSAIALAILSVTASCGEKKKTEESVQKPLEVLVEEENDAEYGSSKTTYTYDSEGRLLTKKETYTNGEAPTTFTYTYDSAGRMLSEAESFYGNQPYTTNYQYNDKGDTLCVVVEYEDEENGQRVIDMKKVYTYDSAGNKTHVYIYHSTPGESEYADYAYLIIKNSYDKDGRLTHSVGYDLDYTKEFTFSRLSILKAMSANPEQEFNDLIGQSLIGPPHHTDYIYKNGRVAESHSYVDGDGVEKQESRTTYQYDAQGNLLKEHQKSEDWELSTTNTYDSEGRQLTCLLDWGEGSGRKSKATLNEKGDTLMLVESILSEDIPEQTVIKTINEFREDGSLKATYIFANEDELGHDEYGAQVLKYNEKGQIISRIQYISNDYEHVPLINQDKPADPEKAINEHVEKYQMKKYQSIKYKYATLK